MKKILLIAIILSVTTLAFSQQDIRIYNYYLFDDYYMNPAYVGSKNHYSLNVMNDLRFIGLDGASPETVVMSAHSRVGKGYLFAKDGKINQFFSKFGNMALGLQQLAYTFGDQYEYHIGVTYGHHIDLNPNVKTKRPHKLVLAFTPKLLVTGFNRAGMTDNFGEPISPTWDPMIPPFNEAMIKPRFLVDVGALYQTIFYDVGFSCLNATNSRFGYESDTVQYLYEETEYGIYELVYSPKLVFNTKIKFMNMIDKKQLEVNFIPRLAAMYSPVSGDMEFFLDAAVTWDFFEMVTSIRRNHRYQISTGVFVNHKRNFKPYTLLQPYIAFDFVNFKVIYAHNYNPNVQVPGYYGGNQISVTFNIARDKVSRKLTNNKTWK